MTDRTSIPSTHYVEAEASIETARIALPAPPAVLPLAEFFGNH